MLLDRLDTRFIVSKAAAEKYGDEMDNYAIGTGPYKFLSWQRGGNLALRAMTTIGEQSRNQRSRLERSEGRSSAGRRSAFGQADVISNLPSKKSSASKSIRALESKKFQGSGCIFWR